MKFAEELKKSFFTALWFILLTFPILVVQVNTIENVVVWRWHHIILIGLGSFLLSFCGQLFLKKKGRLTPFAPAVATPLHRLINEPRLYRPALLAIALFALIFPFVFSHYQINIMTTALIYIMLGLGLNIEVGLAGLLDLGYVAFYAVGAYSYALLNYHFGLGFWTALPVGALLAAFFGILIGFPVLRLRGDYLAIVTLAFAEIIRLVLENWNAFSFGPSGISNIPRPGFFGINLTPEQSAIYLYFLLIILCILTIFVIHRLQHSRIGRAWVALREDELACQAMGIDRTKAKLTAFALGATWAGMAGVLFAAKTTFINPASFTFLESAMILSIVVLGGMGSIVGVIIAALALILLPEYLRVFSDYRMIIFGAALIIMMIFRPQGILADVRKRYEFSKSKSGRGN
ncbi:MAG: branched-chain amino acid ABC transporter permease [Deltaproteobacteria bacterium HGW-Deltaproteobacteria-12]|jgi:branched-chain amino acid transport system permease protein|nr:MAG: branched-chain amino acid ABC transporter permease [Deltaproteobacteria bacterium HGW-Deltaproteobacteria-12]